VSAQYAVKEAPFILHLLLLTSKSKFNRLPSRSKGRKSREWQRRKRIQKEKPPPRIMVKS